MKRSILVGLFSIFILAACSSSKPITPPDPAMISTIQTAETALLTNDNTTYLSTICQQDVEASKAKLDGAHIPITVSGSYDASPIVFDMLAHSHNLALLKIVSGKGKINSIVGKDTVTLNLPPLNVSNGIVLKNEGGNWKICFGATDEVAALAPPPSNGHTTFEVVLAFGRIAVFAGSGIVLVLYGLRYMRSASRKNALNLVLQADGIVAPAEIIERGKDFTVTYRYNTADGTVQEQKMRLVPKDYSSLKVGNQIQVRYLPQNPGAHIIESGATMQFTPMNNRVIGFMFLVVGLLVITTTIYAIVVSLH
jgi:hypothetical protein